MSAAVETYRDDVEATYAGDFSRNREPMTARKRFPEYRRKGGAPTRVSGMHCRRGKRWTWGSGRGARMLNMRAFAGMVAFAVASVASSVLGVTIDYQTIGDPGNAANTNGWGSVSSIFKISKYETTNAQYAEFLNKVDAAGLNPNGVYNTSMATNALGGILFDAFGTPGQKYAVKTAAPPTGTPPGTSYANMPVLFTSWFSAARFANWLQNGQQASAASMETGAYDLNGLTSGAIVSRNPGATVFLPSRDEWYKASFFNGTSYDLYGTGVSSPAPTNTITNLSLANAANFGATVTPTTSPINVGSYVNTTSAYGLYDMLGNATEWTDTALTTQAQVFSGSWGSTINQLSLWNANGSGIFRESSSTTSQIGFRVAAVPEPSTFALIGVGISGLAGYEWSRRRKVKAATLAA